MGRVWRWIGVLAVVLLFTAGAAAALPRFALELHAPHAARRSTAALEKPLERALDVALAKAEIGTVEQAMDFALSATDKLLRFGLEHPTSASFGAVEREGNCVEYANLFARVFDKAAQKGGLSARAYAVHSAKALVFGKTVPMKGWADHDWALIQDGSGEDARRWHVDPTMHDLGLGWDVSANIRGNVNVEQKPAPKEPSEAPKLPQAKKKAPR